MQTLLWRCISDFSLEIPESKTTSWVRLGVGVGTIDLSLVLWVQMVLLLEV